MEGAAFFLVSHWKHALIIVFPLAGRERPPILRQIQVRMKTKKGTFSGAFSR